MVQELKQEFNPAIRIKNGGDDYSISKKVWEWDDEYGYFLKSIETNDGVIGIPSPIYMASAQIEEVWKRYRNTDVYISNLGYAMTFTDNEWKNEFGCNLSDFENGVIYKNLQQDGKKFIKAHILDLINKKNSYEVDLYVPKYETIYSIVAELFLVKQPDCNIVHHIDNNSYNNSVTNLVYIPKDKHIAKLHPMSK